MVHIITAYAPPTSSPRSIPRFLHLCSLQCCLTLLHPSNEVPEFISTRARFEANVLTNEEIYETLCRLPSVEFSYQPFESMLWGEFLKRVDKVSSTEDVDTFADPFGVFLFLHGKKKLTDGVVRAWAKWSQEAR